ncbi:Tetraspanin-10 [Morella rubra]|uniref:Tetraspanin-10 n=1 Tax=Morella rubra TaxID=262757 RepID=A0A6A1WBE4_9ROSI|nr:Tetraspanin-10 [Morella rubra]
MGVGTSTFIIRWVNFLTVIYNWVLWRTQEKLHPLVDRILFKRNFSGIYIILFVVLLWVDLDLSLAVSDHVVLHFGGNSGVHSIGERVGASLFMALSGLVTVYFRCGWTEQGTGTDYRKNVSLPGTNAYAEGHMKLALKLPIKLLHITICLCNGKSLMNITGSMVDSRLKAEAPLFCKVIFLWDFFISLESVAFPKLLSSTEVQRCATNLCQFIVTNNGSGHSVTGLRYKEYQLQDYHSWFLKQLNNTENWKRLSSCLVKSEDCNNLSRKYKTLKQYKLAKLSAIEAGCCRPPSECGYPAVNASYYDLSFHPISSNRDCKLYKNSRAIKCYNCDSCKAGVAQYMKIEWRVVAIFNVILFVVLSIIYLVGCCARRNASRSRSKA